MVESRMTVCVPVQTVEGAVGCCPSGERERETGEGEGKFCFEGACVSVYY